MLEERDEECPGQPDDVEIVALGRLAVDTPVEDDGRVDAERHLALAMHGPGLTFRMGPYEISRLEPGWIVLQIRGRNDLEGDPELLEDRPPLPRRRREDQPVLRAAHISSAGH